MGSWHEQAANVRQSKPDQSTKADQGERLGLAGRLAAAERLSRAGAGIGLGAPTDKEHAALSNLDACSTEKFGFPFMIAVCDLDRIGFLVVFEGLIESDRETGFAEAYSQVERFAE